MNKKILLILIGIIVCYLYPLFTSWQGETNFFMGKDGTGNGESVKYVGVVKEVASDQRIVAYAILEREINVDISDEEYEILLRIVEAEAGGEDEEGKMLVANVILNRVRHKKFPDTIKEVVFQCEDGTAQFSPTVDGRYEKVTVSQETVEAVNRVLEGEDDSQGALYFVSRKAANPEKMKWFDTCLTFLFEHGRHEFFM